MQRYTKIYTLQREKWNILRENPYFQTVFPYQHLFFSKKYTTFARKIDGSPFSQMALSLSRFHD